jgi:membrane protein
VWRLGGLTPWELLKEVAAEARRDRIFGQAAQLSFYFLLGLFPLLMFLASIGTLFLADPGSVTRAALDAIAPLLPAPTFELVQSISHQVGGAAPRPTAVLTLVFAVWSASYGMEAVINGLNAVFDVGEYRPWWRRRMLAIAMTVVLAAAILAALVLVTWGPAIGEWLSSHWRFGDLFGTAWPVLRWTLLLVWLSAAVAIIYAYAPNLRRQTLAVMLPGTLVAVAAWVAAAFAFKLYVQTFAASYTTMYGSLGAVVALLLWLFLSAGMLLVGGEVNATIRWAASDAGAPDARRSLEAGD